MYDGGPEAVNCGAENKNAGKSPAFSETAGVQPRAWITPLMTFTLSPILQLGGVG